MTKAFYERGWRGINIEPNPHFHHLLNEQRSRDTNLRLALGDEEGIVVMNFIKDTGLSTIQDDIADVHHQAGWDIDRDEVTLTTLNSIARSHISSNKDVHFLKVDVEGLEGAVLRGNDWSSLRPWIVLVEATLPMTKDESHWGWEEILVSANYLFAYADGLNRFYVSNEHSELLAEFKYPPNVFDEFISVGQQLAIMRAERAEAGEALQTDVAKQATLRFDHLQGHATGLEIQLDSMLESRSWRLTKPLRWFISQARNARHSAAVLQLKKAVKKTLRILGLMNTPATKSKRPSYASHTHLSSNAQKTYAELKDSIGSAKKG